MIEVLASQGRAELSNVTFVAAANKLLFPRHQREADAKRTARSGAARNKSAPIGTLFLAFFSSLGLAMSSCWPCVTLRDVGSFWAARVTSSRSLFSRSNELW